MTPASEESFSRRDRVRLRGEYQRCYRRGRRLRGPSLMLVVVENEEERPRLGVTASRKVGNSVVRHRIKRRIREIFRRYPRRSALPSLDIVVHVHPTAREKEFREHRRELEKLLRRLLVSPV